MGHARIVHGLAAVSVIAAALLATCAFIFLTPFSEISPEQSQRDSDAVATIRLICLGAVALGTFGAILASSAPSFRKRPKASIGIVVVAAPIVLAGVFRIFQTVGI